MALTALLLVTVAMFHCSLCYYNESDIRDLKRLADNLSETVNQLVDILNKDHLVDTINTTNSPRCPQLADIPSLLPEDFPPLLPLEARLEAVDGKNSVRISLKYWAKEGQPRVLWFEDYYGVNKLSDSRPNSVPRSPNGVYETQAVVPPGDGTLEHSATVVLLLDYLPYIQHFSFNTSRVHNQVQTCIPLPVYERDPKGDIVYVPGQDVDVTLQVPKELTSSQEEQGMYFNNVDTAVAVLDLDSGEMMGDLENIASEPEKKDLLYSQQLSVRSNTSQHRISGLVELFLTDGVRRGDLINNVKLNVPVIIRPIGQSGPFPEGSLMFYSWWHRFREDEESDVEGVQCDRSSEYGCYIVCGLYGSGITTLKLVRETNDGDWEEVTERELNLLIDYLDYYQILSYKFDENDVNERGKYKCMATNSAGVEVTHKFKVTVYTRTRIDRELSTILNRNDTNLELLCVAYGDPQPNITFTVRHGFTTENYEAVDVVYNEDTEQYQARLSINLTDESDTDNESDYYSVHQDNTVGHAACELKNDEGVYLDYYSYELQ